MPVDVIQLLQELFLLHRQVSPHRLELLRNYVFLPHMSVIGRLNYPQKTLLTLHHCILKPSQLTHLLHIVILHLRYRLLYHPHIVLLVVTLC